MSIVIPSLILVDLKKVRDIIFVIILITVCGGRSDGWMDDLTAKAVQGAALTFEGVHHVHGSHGLPLGVLGVGDGITDDVLKEHLQDATGLLVDEARDSLHTTSASKTADGRLGDTLDVITKNLPVTLSAPLSKTFSSFASSRHVSELSM